MDTPIEIDFYFPMDTQFALSKIKVQFSNIDRPDEVSEVETVIEERAKAENIYDDAVATKKNVMPILAKTVTRDKRSLIKVSMGNFPPNSKAILTCTMNSKLPL